MPSFEYKDYYNLYGLRFAMPLFDINSFKNIEIAKLNHIKSNLLLEYKKKEESNLYEMILKRVEIVKEKIFLANEDLKLYKSLLKSTKEQFKGGEKTIYDVEIMENSLKTKEIDKEIYDIDMQLLLLELYKKMELK
jgi:outer membrane protein TolC